MLTSLPARCVPAAITLMVLTVWAMSTPLPSAQAATPKSSASTAILAQGAGMADRPSVQVRRLQRILERAGFDVGSPGVDGRFGPLTAAAVRRMQHAYGLVADGVVGATTRRVVALIADREKLRRQRARDRSETARPRAPRGSGRPQTAPSGTTPARPTPGRPTATTDAIGAQRADRIVPMVLGAIAVLLAAVALAVTFAPARRPHDAATVVGVPRDLYLEGHSGDDLVGAFHGFALATALPSPGRGDGPEDRYLVDDPGKPAPVWVRRSEIRRSQSELNPGEPVLGYVTADDAAREHEQFIAIEEACARAGWELTEIIRDEDRKRMVDRPGLTRALDEIAAGRARGLVIGDVQRLVRSIAGLGWLLEWFRDAEAALIALDLDLDTATLHGRQSASTVIALGEWERDRAQSRTRSGLASVKGPERAGPKGRPTPDDRIALVERINAMRHAGMNLQAIADQLNKEGVPVLLGGAKWRPSAVQATLASPARSRSSREQLPPIAHREREE